MMVRVSEPSPPGPQSIVQRAYVYVVALVAIHMIVLGVANILRVLAEMALAAPSGGFTGLPFVFADFSRPRELYREQASLAIALLLVGAPAWWIHFRLAQRAARAAVERASALRSLYLHLVVFVTALLVFGYGQRTVRLVLQGTTFAQDQVGPEFFGLEANWEARAAGAGAMALAAALALAFHLRVSLADRRAVPIAGRAAEVRHFALYALVVVGVFFATFTTVTTLDGIWRRVADAFVTLPGVRGEPFYPPGVTPPPQPSRDDILRFQLLGAIPAIVAGVVLWLGTWLPLQRGLTKAPDAEVERRSIVRKLAIYLVVFISAVAVLVSATFALSSVGRRILGDPVVEQYNSLWHELGFPVTTIVVFGALWLFHRRVVESEASRETELARAATIRRLYTYLICAIGLAMAAIGAAGAIGVIGSQIIGFNTHQHGETATYLSLLIVGGGAWAYHWRQARQRLDDDERASQPRRFYLYAAVLGGVLGLLVFGSAGLYRLVNAALAFSFTIETWHDVWHFGVDAGVSGAAFLAHLRLLRAERGAAVAAEAVPSQFAFLVRMSAADREAAQARIAIALPDASVVAVRTTPDGPGAVAIESLTPLERGPSVVAVIGAGLAALVVLLLLSGLFRGISSMQSEPPRPVSAVAGARGPMVWEVTMPTTVSGRDAEPTVIGAPFDLPVVVEMVVRAEPGATGDLVWILSEADDHRVSAAVSIAGQQVELRQGEGSRVARQGVGVPDIASGRPLLLVALIEPGYVGLDADKSVVGTFHFEDQSVRRSVTVSVTGGGTFVIESVRVFALKR